MRRVAVEYLNRALNAVDGCEMLTRNPHGSNPKAKLQLTRARWTVLCLLIVVFGGACTTPYNPFMIPDSELRERVQTIALAPLRVASSLADPAFARSQIEPLVTARLIAGGFQVVSSEEMEQLWRSIAMDMGNLFDPESGEVDGERWEAVEGAVYRDLQSEHGADAILYLTVNPKNLYLPILKPEFYGTKDNLYWPARKLGFSDYRGESGPPTLARALCLDAVLYDMEERKIYYNRAGLELFETFAWQTKAERPLEERLRDPEKLKQAIEIAIGPLANAAHDR